VEVQITEAVASVRPFIICCIIRNLDLAKTSTTFKQFIALQVKFISSNHRQALLVKVKRAF